MSVTRKLLRQRHNYYRWLLVVEVLALLGLRPLQQAPQLVSLVYLTIAGVGVLMDSPLLPHNRLTPHLEGSVLPQKDHHRLQRVIQRRRLLANGWLIGFTGGIVLNSLLVLDPQAFSLSANLRSDWPLAIAHAPVMLGAAFGSLTTLGSPVFNHTSLTSVSASVGITIVGQLYVAILIAGVLGKPRQIAAVRKAAHPRGRSQAPSPRLRRNRR